MNAFEFVKEKGIGEVKAFLDLPEYTIDQLMVLQAGLCVADLKRIVESHEIVADYYGLLRAKEHAESKYTAPEIAERLKQAISDVEACQ